MKKKFNDIQDIIEILYNRKRKIREYELKFLQEIVGELPENSKVLEIGSFIGKSSVCIAEVLEPKNGKLFCVDNFSETIVNNQEQLLKENLHGYSNIEIVKSDSKTFFEKNTQLFDMIYIDGDHRIDSFISDLVFCIKFSSNKITGHDFSIMSPWIIHAIQILCEKFNCTYQAKGYVWELKNIQILKTVPQNVLSKILLDQIKNNQLYFLSNSQYQND